MERLTCNGEYTLRANEQTSAVDVTIRTLAAVHRVETLLAFAALEASLMVGLRKKDITQNMDHGYRHTHAHAVTWRRHGWISDTKNAAITVGLRLVSLIQQLHHTVFCTSAIDFFIRTIAVDRGVEGAVAN